MFSLFKRKKETSSIPETSARSFTAAATNRLVDWILSYAKINATLKQDYIQLVLRSRDLAKNNEFIVAYLENLKRNIIGKDGFTLQCKPKTAAGEHDAENAVEIESLWKEYQSAFKKFVTLDETQGGRDFDILILRTLITDGEVFIRRVEDPFSKFGYRYELLDSLTIDPYYNEELDYNGARVVMGVELDKRGREVAFYMRDNRNSDQYFCGERVRIPADEVLHVYRKYFSTQTRGYTPLAGIIMNLSQMDAYKEAEIIHARIQACSMAVFEKNGSNGGALQRQTDAKGDVPAEFAPGMFVFAPDGYTTKSIQNTSNTSIFGSFWKAVLRSIANALGLSYNKASGDYESVNYSSLREATLEDRASFEELQQFFIDSWKEHQFYYFIEACIQNRLLFGDIDSLFPHKFFGRRFPWVDPQKEIAALEKEYDLLLTDPITELESRGVDPDEALERWARWKQKVEEKKLSFMQQDPLKIASEPEPIPIPQGGQNV